MFAIYTFIYTLAVLFLFPFEYLKRPKALRKRWLREKWGKGAATPAIIHKKGPVFLHAVSVGEVIASVPFIKAFKDRHPETPIVVSTITDTGQKVASERLKGIAEVIYLPFDLPFAIRALISRLKPSAFITMETEIWPNLFRIMNENGIPVIILNGRISERSFKGYGKIKFLMESILKKVSLLCMQDEVYAGRVSELGANPKNIVVTGSFKFDINLSHEQLPWAGRITGPVVVAGSTHRGEEALMLSAYERLRGEFAGLNLILAPRHPERFDEVEELLKGSQTPYVRRSLPWDSVSGKAILLDTIGELSSVYAYADIAVIGGSFIEHGGQNPLEPACYGKPVVCGPHMENFPFMEDFYSAGAAIKAEKNGLYDVLKELLSSPEKRRSIGKAAKGLLEKNRGAVDKALKAVEGVIGL